MAKKFINWKTKDRQSEEPDEQGSDSGRSPSETKEEPRVRAFARRFKPAMTQEGEDVECMTYSDLRKCLNAYPSASGFDPLTKLINQLEERYDFQLEISDFRNELVLPVRRINKLIPISNE